MSVMKELKLYNKELIIYRILKLQSESNKSIVFYRNVKGIMAELIYYRKRKTS